jgi:hypothetical protein
MNDQSIVIIGGPDTGKTNYVARLWHALKSGKGALRAVGIPRDITHVEETIAHLFGGRFAPRSGLPEGRRDFRVAVDAAGGDNSTRIIIPDISGELWQKAVLLSEISADWMEELHRASGAMLFVRAHSDLNQDPLDWVTSRKLLGQIGDDEDRDALPTQVMLCELVRFLELSLALRPDGGPPRLAIVVTAWDLLDVEAAAKGPEQFLEANFPLFAGRISDLTQLDVQVFALSVVGGDIGRDPDYRAAFLDRPFEQHGWVIVKNPETAEWTRQSDVTLPVAWVIGT